MARGRSGWSTFKAMIAQGAKDLHNQIVPAFPAYTHGVDEPGTPQMTPADAPVEQKPSFEARLAESVPAAPAADRQPDRGMEL